MPSFDKGRLGGIFLNRAGFNFESLNNQCFVLIDQGGDMESKKEICVLCAWRESCQKKFSISGKDMRCADFVRDLSITGEQKEKVKGQDKE
jgi:hypothetical protein